MIPKDLQHHIVYSFALALAGVFLFGPRAVFALTLLVGGAKEIVWDGMMGRGNPDLADMAANIVGLAAAFLAWIVGVNIGWIGKAL